MVDNEGALDAYGLVEKELCRIPDVSAARIVADATGRPVEVHILASPAKHAKQIVRDVQSVAMATFGLDLDRRIISVVQLESIPLSHDPAAATASAEPGDPIPPDPIPPDPIPPDLFSPDPFAAGPITAGSVAADPLSGDPLWADPLRADPPAAAATVEVTESRGFTEGAPLWTEPVRRTNGTARRQAAERRIVFDGVTAVRNGTDCSAQVSLRTEGDQVVGITEGLLVSGSIYRLVASATLAALRQIEPAAERADIETATVVRVGERLIAVANVVFAVPPYEEVVSGSAVVRVAGEHDAIARAVLDAVSRRLTYLTR